VANPTDRLTPATLTLIFTLAGALLGAVAVDLTTLGWLIGEVRFVSLLGGALVGAVWARLLVLEGRVRQLESGRPSAADAPDHHASETPPRRPAPEARAPEPVSTTASPPPEPASDLPPGLARRLLDWFSHGNVPVKIGLIVLLVGVAALLRYVTEQGWLSAPIELRLAGIAAAAIAALGFAWRERERRRIFAVSLQGAAIGVLALTVFAALRLYQVLPAGLAFALLVALVAAAAVLALLQHALVLAVLALITGLAAPILVSSGSGSHIALFSWYAVLNLAMLGLAWYRDWPLLYRLGFSFTFLIGTAWGVLRYVPAQFAGAQFFLSLFFLLYLLIPILVERRRPAGQATRVDAVLVFGLPLFWLPLQAGLLDGRQPAIAAAALAAALLYLTSAAWLLRRWRIGPLGRAHALLAVAMATVAVPFAFAESTVVMVWALEAAALIWYGIEDKSRISRIAGLALLSLSTMIWLLWLAVDGYSGPLIGNAGFLGGISLTLGAAIAAWRYHDGGASARWVNLLALAALVPWAVAGVTEIGHNVPIKLQNDVFLVWLGLSAAIGASVHRQRAWPVTALACAAALGLGAVAALGQQGAHSWPWGGYGGPAWLAFIALAWLARRQLACSAARWQALAALAIQVSLGVMLALVLIHVAEVRLALASGWHWLAGALPLLGLLAWLQSGGRPWPGPPLPAGDERHWPLHAGLAVLCLGLIVSLSEAGPAHPLTFVPLLNPLELTQAAALVLLVRSAAAAPGNNRGWLPWVAALVAVTVTVMALRAVHHLASIAWDGPVLLASETAQATLTVTWTVLGVLAWVSGSRRGLRGLWLAGALILGAVLIKLVLVDRSYLSNVAGIVSFLGFGLLSVLVGYLAPAPPRTEPSEQEPSA